MDRRTFLSLSGAAAAVAAAPGLAATSTGAPVVAGSGSATTANAATPARRVAPDPVPTALALPNLTLWTHEKKPVRLYDDLLKDKIVLINMFFVACTDGQCPLVTANLARVQPLLGERLGRDIFSIRSRSIRRWTRPRASAPTSNTSRCGLAGCS